MSACAIRRLFGVLFVGTLLGATLLVVPTADAVHATGVFQLDGNAIDDGPGDDWENVVDGTDSADVSTFIVDDIAPADDTYFHSGSSDVNDVTQWRWIPDKGGIPDKDDLTNVYAAAYLDDGDITLYFGADRFANEGDAELGFWFFQDPVGLTDTQSQGGFEFSGQHRVGDLLVLANFTGGGQVISIKAYEWVGSGGSDGALDLIGDGLDCIGLAPGDDLCATSNQDETPAPWPYTPKFGPAGTFPVATFFEGGINLGQLLPDADCFSSVLATTRASSSIPARLHDFALGAFELCAVEIAKSGDELSKVGDDVTYTFTITNTGVLTLHLEAVEDDQLGNLTAEATESGCAELASGASCSFEVTHTVPADAPDPYLNVVTATYRPDAALTGDAVTATDTHATNLFQPAVEVTKSGPASATVGDTIAYEFAITNTGSDDSPDLVLVSVDDDVLGDLTTDAAAAGCDRLAAGSDCGFTVDHTVSDADAPTLTNTVDVLYNPDGFPNEITDSASHTLDVVVPPEPLVPGIDLAKFADVAVVTFSEDEEPPVITYTYVITNTGEVPLTDVTLTDDVLGDLVTPLDGVVLQPGESFVATASHTVTEEEALTGGILNVAITTGLPPEGPAVEAVDDEQVDIVMVLPFVIEAPEQPAPPPPEPEPAVGELPVTGAPIGTMLMLSLWLVLAGVVLMSMDGSLRRSLRTVQFR